MPIYSHSRLSTYEQCPLKYKLCHLDGIKRDTEGVEAFLGSMVHETLKKCYDDARLTRLDTLDELLACYDSLWQKNWHDGIVIMKKDVTPENYRAAGRKMIGTFYGRYAPFDRDITIGTEMRLLFSLDDRGAYRLQGYIDRLARTPDGVHHIIDYKTSAHLPGQDDIDGDRQLALYQIGVQKKWPDIKEVRLVWHYLAFDRELVSTRHAETLTGLTEDTIKLINKIKSDREFAPNESYLCEWCEYPDLCPNRKHLYTVEALPANKFLKEPGVVLVNKYAELKEKSSEIDEETALVKEAIMEYARRERVNIIRGSNRKVKVKFGQKLKFPGKNEPGRHNLEDIIDKAGKWQEVSQLDVAALTGAIEDGLWDKALIDEVMKYGRIDETGAVYLSKLKETEE